MDEKPFRYDIKGLANDMEVDLQTLSALYCEFFHEMRLNIDESKILYGKKDWMKLERVIHNIKGISACLNINDIYSISQKLDMELKNQKYENVFSDIISISNLLNSCETDIKDFFKKDGVII